MFHLLYALNSILSVDVKTVCKIGGGAQTIKQPTSSWDCSRGVSSQVDAFSFRQTKPVSIMPSSSCLFDSNIAYFVLWWNSSRVMNASSPKPLRGRWNLVFEYLHHRLLLSLSFRNTWGCCSGIWMFKLIGKLSTRAPSCSDTRS